MTLEQASQRSVTDMKHDDVLKAALAHFLKHGYTGAAMADIARDADVSTATLYKYFRSKKELFTTIAMNAAHAVRELDELTLEKAPPEEIFSHLLLIYWEAQQEGHVNDLMRIVIAESRSSPDIARTIFRSVVEMRYRGIKKHLDLMVERGVLKPHDTNLGARLAIGMLREVFVWPAMFDPEFRIPPDALDQAREAFNVYMACFAAEEAQEAKLA